MADLLQLEGVWAGYGEAVVLEEISFSLESGGSLALLGRNGMGKSTLLATLMGATRFKSGRMSFDGRDLARVAGHARAALGLGILELVVELALGGFLHLREHFLQVLFEGGQLLRQLGLV